MLRGTRLPHVELAGYTSFRVGGPAKQLYQPADRADLIEFLHTLAPTEPLLWIGLGSNLLVPDTGFPGTVIFLQGCLTHLEKIDDTTLHAEAGVSCGTFARFSAKQQLTGGEFLAGIPGTLGGALKMNAGCHGAETWDHVIAVETINRQGIIHTRTPDEFNIHYRHIDSPHEEWFLSADFRFSPGNTAESLEKIKSLLAHRKATQPTHLPNCGSVFRNPPHTHAAKLIEGCGLKGYRINDAGVSEKHANFIINHGHATATDITQLIHLIQDKVKEKYGISLIPEVVIPNETRV
ncbi:MAG: UDP-N-acetylmuramate dehydrogenase [Gammaproteobacteria bacterium]|nr:UDP-N-acetylmuramate dehydrogenase [Gammaproteobacteria bacterium]